MIIVDSSVWIDYFNNQETPQVHHLDLLLGQQEVGLGDVILTEVLQGFRLDKDFNKAKELLLNFDIFSMLGETIALQAIDNYRFLRKKGITIRKTNDVIIATFCIQNSFPLLFVDKDFKPFVAHLGLKAVLLS